MTIDELLDQARSKGGFRTDMALAEAIGFSRQAVSSWRHGAKTPDPVACEKLAVLSGIPLHRVLGIVGEARAISAAEKKVWRKLAAAMFISLVVTPLAALASGIPTNGHAEQGHEVCIMRSKRPSDPSP